MATPPMVKIDLPDTSTGTHANLLRTLSVAVKAFHDDLAELGLDEQVISVTFSEFGRKVAQNGSFGTDHGSLAPMFIIGNKLLQELLVSTLTWLLLLPMDNMLPTNSRMIIGKYSQLFYKIGSARAIMPSKQLYLMNI